MITVSFRLPKKLIASLDRAVKKNSPAIRNRTQYVEIKLTEAIKEDERADLTSTAS
jgi:metal-responsive CopG/Arc/MetJ family transcriptional regulator